MNFLSSLALLLLTLFGYSAGRIALRRGRLVAPGAPDLWLILALWVAAFLARARWLSGWAVLAGLAAGFLLGAAVTLAVRARLPQDKTSAGAPAPNGLWARWKAFAREAGNFQSRALLAWFYILLVTPFGLLVRLLSDPLHTRRDKFKTYWLPRQEPPDTLENARRQF